MTWSIYRVIAVTDKHNQDSLNHLSNPGFVLSVSALSYCTPGIVFWLSEYGIEVPESECVLMELHCWSHQKQNGEFVCPVKFEWDVGQYVGMFESQLRNSGKLWWAGGQTYHATICNISSL